MKQSFQAYPEIGFLDATYKLLKIGTLTYLMLVEDSNGMSEMVFVCLLAMKMKTAFHEFHVHIRKTHFFMLGHILLLAQFAVIKTVLHKTRKRTKIP